MFGLLALAGGGTGVMFGWRALCESERLQIRAVDVKGNHRVRSAEIHAYTNIGVGDSILRADLDGAALSLRRHPWIATARVQRQLPDRIMIAIEEHEATLVVALGELYLANASGELFKKLSADDGVVLPVLTGIARERVMQDPAEVAISIGDAIALHNSLLASGRALGALQELHWDDDLGWSVVTQPETGGPHLTVHLGFAAEERVPLAVAGLAGLQASGRRPRVVWADGRTRERIHIQLLGDVGESKNRTLMAQAR
jgi:cell division protein FtsQ